MGVTLDPLTFEVGHHTDLWIARHVMEWPEINEWMPYTDYINAFGGVIIGGDRPTIFRYGTIPDIFQPSSKMEDALEVLRKMKAKGWFYVIRGDPKSKLTRVIFGRSLAAGFDFSASESDLEPLAICRAAVAAITKEDGREA